MIIHSCDLCSKYELKLRAFGHSDVDASQKLLERGVNKVSLADGFGLITYICSFKTNQRFEPLPTQKVPLCYFIRNPFLGDRPSKFSKSAFGVNKNYF